MRQEQILEIFKEQKISAKNQDLLPLTERVSLLKKLKKVIIDHESEIHSALNCDLGRCETESYLAEIQSTLGEIDFTIKRLKRWIRPTKVRTPLILLPGKSKIVHEPKGVVLVIAPWNYPFLLALNPLISAVSAGNTVILKPSEIAAKTSNILFKLISNNFNQAHIAVIEGGVEETISLLNNPFDHIFYTGNGQVAKSILKQAAVNLTPVTLELGGKSPCVVFSEKNLELSAKRIIWGKFLNAGQTCVAPDYILIPSALKEKFLSFCRKHLENFYNGDASKSPDYGRIINSRHFQRVMDLFTKNDVLMGGKYSKDDLYIEPTLINATEHSQSMKDEIFGPVLPIIETKDVDSAIAFINSRQKPLAIYLFSDSKDEQNRFVAKARGGGMCINDTIVHLASPYLPFGGVGHSGYGAYHGKFGFDLFSHHKTVLTKSFLFDLFLKYPPYIGKLKFIRWIFKFI